MELTEVVIPSASANVLQAPQLVLQAFPSNQDQELEGLQVDGALSFDEWEFERRLS